MSNGRVIKGRLQALGSYRELGSGNCYDYATFVEENGNIVRLTNLTVPPIINDFVKNGVEGEFYFHTFKKYATLLAMKKGEQKIFSADDPKTIYKFYMKKMRLLLFFIALAFVFLYTFVHDKMKMAAFTTTIIIAVLFHFLYLMRIGAHYLRPAKAEQLIRDLGFN